MASGLVRSSPSVPRYDLSDHDKARLQASLLSLALGGSAIGLLLGILEKARGSMLLVWSVGGAVVGAFVAWMMATVLGEVAGRVAGRILMPSGGGSPAAPDYSYQDALVARGEIDAALRSYEALLSASGSPTVMLRAADLYMGSGRDRARAAALYRQARQAAGCSRAQDLYASNRVIELHLTTPGEERRALPELRRLAERHAGTPDGERARESIATLKRSLEV
ncbi:MAG TPA: hypothetical protein VEA99_13965 [Gemmatimonadaceae bacterium]|nr:hypothetical protein [Gemmatimonadaceae bacterium]